MAKKSGAADLPRKRFASMGAWEKWLEAHHERSKGVWIAIAKGGSRKSVSYAEALEVALCYGWIDGQKQSLDEKEWLQKFTPRSPRSRWSKINVEKATRLIDAGRMREAGLEVIEEAKASGQWDAAYNPMSSAEVPEDLQRALDARPRARAFFEELDRRNRYAILYRVQTAKKAETRARRITTFVDMLAQGKRLYPSAT